MTYNDTCNKINDTCTNNKRYMNDILSSETFNFFLYDMQRYK